MKLKSQIQIIFLRSKSLKLNSLFQGLYASKMTISLKVHTIISRKYYLKQTHHKNLRMKASIYFYFLLSLRRCLSFSEYFILLLTS
jgi:hypothetical protein